MFTSYMIYYMSIRDMLEDTWLSPFYSTPMDRNNLKQHRNEREAGTAISAGIAISSR
jgi:hypothetical protein